MKIIGLVGAPVKFFHAVAQQAEGYIEGRYFRIGDVQYIAISKVEQACSIEFADVWLLKPMRCLSNEEQDAYYYACSRIRRHVNEEARLQKLLVENQKTTIEGLQKELKQRQKEIAYLDGVVGTQQAKIHGYIEFPITASIPLILHCPDCLERHIDEGEFATKLHHTHVCQHCGFVWRPAVVPTVGVQFLPGFKDAGLGLSAYQEQTRRVFSK